MDEPFLAESLILLQAMCVIVLAAYMITRSRYFARLIEGDASRTDQLLLALFFGLLSIYGSVVGISINGAIINIRDLGPAVGGLTCGPLVGLGAGLIGAAFRYSGGGFTALPCTLAAILSGLLGGLIWLWRGKFPGIVPSIAFIGSMELLHMLLNLALARPYSRALEVVSEAVGPMELSSVLGVFLFTYIVSNFLKERETMVERDRYRRELVRKEDEIALAAEIQKSFLPRQIPSLPGFDLAAASLPAMVVGGDFYDFISIPDGKLGLVVADVSGKSIPGALFMALSKTIVRTNALRCNDVALILGDSNQVIASESTAGMFVTLFMGILDPDSGGLVYANAGHNPPQVFRAEDSRFDALGVTGVALGIMDEFEYSHLQTALEPGDILVMYTDGIVEAMNGAGELFGLQRLRSAIAKSAHLSAEGVLRTVLDDLSSFSSGEEQYDDITALVVKAW